MDSIFERLVLQEVERLDPHASTGRPRALSDEQTLCHIFRVLRTGMQWREVETEVSHTTILRRIWRTRGVFTTAYRNLIRTYKKLYPTQYYCVDSAYVKNMFATQCTGRNHTDRGRRAIKVSVIVDQTGAPHGMCCHPGNRPDVVLLDDTLQSCFDSVCSLPLYADKGYDSRGNRSVCTKHGVTDRIFRRRCKTTRRTNAKRVVVEHTFAWMKQYRRLLYVYERCEHQLTAFLLIAFGNILSRRVSEFVSTVSTNHRDA